MYCNSLNVLDIPTSSSCNELNFFNAEMQKMLNVIVDQNADIGCEKSIIKLCTNCFLLYSKKQTVNDNLNFMCCSFSIDCQQIFANILMCHATFLSAFISTLFCAFLLGTFPMLHHAETIGTIFYNIFGPQLSLRNQNKFAINRQIFI